MRRAQDGLSMDSSFVSKTLYGLIKTVTSPRKSLSWVLRGHLAKDSVFVNQTYWYAGSLPRVPLVEVMPEVREVEVALPRAFDRKPGTSITLEEAGHLAAIAKAIRAVKVLEIGTFDGNTALTLASNLGAEAEVVTVDLPPDFVLEEQDTLAYSDGELNLTPREQLGRQFRGHPLSSRIRQIHGDSAKLDWGTFGGPFQLIFIDGCHSEDYVLSDSRNALQQLAPGGIIVWHDYGMIPGLSAAVDRIGRETARLKAFALEGTRLAIGRT